MIMSDYSMSDLTDTNFDTEINHHTSNLFEMVKLMDARTRFKYAAVVIASLVIFSRFQMGVNILVALLVGYVLIKYQHDKDVHHSDVIDKEHSVKLNYIDPKPLEMSDFPDLIDFFFSIQDLAIYNPQAYTETVSNVDKFLEMYIVSKKVTRFCEDKYQIAETKLHNALNALHSMIFSIKNNRMVIQKLNRAHMKLNVILKRYLKEMYNHCVGLRKKRYMSSENKPIDFGSPKPYNWYLSDTTHTYEYY